MRASARDLYKLGLPDLHHARPRHPAGGRAGARGPARGHRERRRRQVRWPSYRQYLDARADTPTTAAGRPRPICRALVVTLDAKTGNIRAMVGGRDFEDSKFNRATQALRQPGSTFKPIVYAAAVEAGYPLSHVMVDDPLTVEIATDTSALGPAELRSRVRRADDAPARALHVAQHHRHQAGHGAGRAGGDQRGHQVRAHDAGCRRIRRSTSARRT